MPSRASRMRSAARTARSGSSSCTAGTPKTPTTASPMNFSTVPPWVSISLRARGVVAAQQGVDVLGVGGLAHGGEGDEVAEEGGDDLALLGDRRRSDAAWSRTWSRRRSRRGPRSRSWGRRSSPPPGVPPDSWPPRPHPTDPLGAACAHSTAERRLEEGMRHGESPGLQADACSAVRGVCGHRRQNVGSLADSEGALPDATKRRAMCGIKVVPPAGIEPATPGLGNLCSIH